MGIFCGSWGKRETLGGNVEQRRRTHVMNMQIARNPVSIIILAEATEDLEYLLMNDRSRGDPDASGVARRDAHEHFVVRGREEDSFLIGARTDVAKGIAMKHFEVRDDHRYREGGK